MSALRNPLVPLGFVLVILGIGNWYTGHEKIIELEHLLAAGNLPPPVQHFDEFRELTARTNATLLRPLHGGDETTSLITAKLDLYRVVLAGGRMLILLGLFCAAAGFTHTWYRQRLAERQPNWSPAR